MGQAQPLAGWCWVLSVVHAQMGPCSYIELRVWRCRTNHRTHNSDMPRTSGTHRNTWTDGFGCRHTMLAEYHHCQHLKMWNPSKRRRIVDSVDVASIKQLLVKLVLAASWLCGKVNSFEIVERRSLKS